jgi:hypothetical protein
VLDFTRLLKKPVWSPGLKMGQITHIVDLRVRYTNLWSPGINQESRKGVTGTMPDRLAVEVAYCPEIEAAILPLGR